MYKNYTYLFSVLWISTFVTFPLPLLGQSTLLTLTESFYQDSLNDWYNLKPHLHFQQELSVDFNPQKGTIPDNWQTIIHNETPNWENNIWLQLPINNLTKENKELTLLLHADLLDVWYQDAAGNWQHQTGGNLRPRAMWDSRHHEPEYASPHTIQFSVEPNHTTTLFIKIGPIDYNSTLNPMLCNRTFFINHSNHYFQRTIATQSFFHGILLVMMLFTLGMFLLNRDTAYLFYAGYAFAISLFLGYTFEFQNFTFLAEYPRLGRVLLNISQFAFPILYNLFLIHFLHTEGWRTDLKKQITLFNKVLLILGGLSSLGLIIFPPAIFKMIHLGWLFLPISIIGLGGLVYISWQYWRSNKQLARFVALNNLFMFIGMTVSVLVFYVGAIGVFDGRIAAFWGILFLEGTIVLQLLSFSLSLSYKGLETERERVKLKELDQLKSRFFANISHEFRTPLTLILGPVQQLKATNNNPTEQKQLRTAEKYAQSLLRLVNQILDLTKLDVGKMQLEPTVFDWVNMAKVITYSFESAAQQKAIQLRFKSELTSLPVQLDQSKMEQILINLIANALKFTQTGGKVEVHSTLLNKKNTLQIIVKDSGVGISDEQQKYIFQHFYQANHGDFTVDQPSSGIGLSLTKELVDLHHGTIQVKSQRGLGTSFIIEIPLPHVSDTFDPDSYRNDTLNPNNYRADTLVPTESNVSDTLKVSDTCDTSDTAKPTVLIVEDHRDIQQYIQSCLAKDYQLVVAVDGEKGIETAIKTVPDLIITDVMMPKKDGFELTKTLKKNPATSHIPIIILTGKSSKESKITGLQSAADDYLTKPFDAEELQLRIKNLLDNRQKWIAHFQKTASKPTEDLNIPSIEDAFIQKALKAVEENLGDENFTVEKLGRALLLDRTQLFRKLKAITGQNPSNFIRTVRLKKAYTLLANRSATVGEVAFSVGFSSTNYFNRCFKTQFGKTPGAVLNG